jgi:hypothetical protein
MRLGVAVITLLFGAQLANAGPYSDPDAGVYQVASAQWDGGHGDDGGTQVTELGPGWWLSDERRTKIEKKLIDNAAEIRDANARAEYLAQNPQGSAAKSVFWFSTGVGTGVVLFVVGLLLVSK